MNAVVAETSERPPLVRATQLTKRFPIKTRDLNLFSAPKFSVNAVDEVSFEVMQGEALGIVGESGCGKSTTARVLTQLIEQDSGTIVFDGREVGSKELSMRAFRHQVQMVFQDSYASLNPRMTIEDSIAFGPRVHGLSPAPARRRAHDLLARVGLEPRRFAIRYPHELSGGQRQRVNIARALAVEPRLVVLDEPVSALDKSVEAQVLNLLMDLKAELGLTYLFISHDLHVVRHICDRVIVMYLGKVVEIGTTSQVFDSPRHPYTRALLRSIPSGDPRNRVEVAPLSGDPPSPIDPPSGCRFHPRCMFAQPVCSTEAPYLTDLENGHATACLRWQTETAYVPNPGFTAAVNPDPVGTEGACHDR